MDREKLYKLTCFLHALCLFQLTDKEVKLLIWTYFNKCPLRVCSELLDIEPTTKQNISLKLRAALASIRRQCTRDINLARLFTIRYKNYLAIP